MSGAALRPFGFAESFRFGERERVERVVSSVRQVGCRQLKVSLSPLDYFRSGGVEWLDWLFARVASELELLPCLRYTADTQRPGAPSEALRRARSQRPGAPPETLRRARAYAEFVDAVLTRHGKHFGYVELCSPPPMNQSERPEDSWLLSAEILTATLDAARGGWNIVLGTPVPATPKPPRGGAGEEGANSSQELDFYWVHALGQRGLLDEIFAVSLQGQHHQGNSSRAAAERWQAQCLALREVLSLYGARASLWLTEGGYSTEGRDEARQAELFARFLQIPAERHYWDAWEDRPPTSRPLDPGHRRGIVHADRRPKLLARLLTQDATTGATCLESWSAPSPLAAGAHDAPVVVIGGAGFIGCNLVKSFLEDGLPVVVLDNLSRPGVERNLTWLCREFGDRVRPLLTDICEEERLGEVIGQARAVLHMAAQVAVTSSLDDPLEDFEVNAYGTLRVLEALRAARRPIPLVFASTNKVYGHLADLGLELTSAGYQPADAQLRQWGISEERPLKFCTPYGCSKGVADQYVLDYARSFGLPTAVLRMSCIYGPRQFGTEDQGWVAHFALQALQGRPVTLYGDGWQVRDVLHVSDAVRAYRAVLGAIDTVGGQAFNLGGGADNAVCLQGVLDELAHLTGHDVAVLRGAPRTGDQLYFVADNRKLERAVGWTPRVGWRDGVRDLWTWLESAHVPLGGSLGAPPAYADPHARSLMA